jgi:hypothetical protein
MKEKHMAFVIVPWSGSIIGSRNLYIKYGILFFF